MTDASKAGAEYALGVQATQDGELAHTDLWRLMADHGDAHSMNELGARAEKDGDRATARTWYRRAADLGDLGGMRNLGALAYKDGDRDTARTWCQRAADLGRVTAMNDLGVMAYEEGDWETARAWWTRAAALGHVGATRNLRALASGAPGGEEVEELKKLISAFAAELDTPTMPYINKGLLERGLLTEMPDADRAAGKPGLTLGATVFDAGRATELRWEATSLKRSGHYLASAEKIIEAFRLDGNYDLVNIRNLWKTALCGGDARGAVALIRRAVSTYERYEIARRHEQLPFPPHDDLADVLNALKTEQSCQSRLQAFSGNPAYVLPRPYQAIAADVQGQGTPPAAPKPQPAPQTAQPLTPRPQALPLLRPASPPSSVPASRPTTTPPAATRIEVVGSTQSGFAYSPTITIHWNGRQVGTVDHGGRFVFEIAEAGEVRFKHGFRSRRVRLEPDVRTIRLQLEWDRTWGRLLASRIDR